MSKYAELDAAIVRAIGNGEYSFRLIYSGEAARLAEAVKPVNPWRAVDARLQALKRAGRITFTQWPGWQLTAVEKA